MVFPSWFRRKRAAVKHWHHLHARGAPAIGRAAIKGLEVTDEVTP